MSGESVLNFFEQAGPDGDNQLVTNGTVNLLGDTNVKTGVQGDFTTISGQDIASHPQNITFPLAATAGALYVFPALIGALHQITITLQDDASVATTDFTFHTYTDSGGPFTLIPNSQITIPLDAVAGDFFSSEPTGAGRNLTASTAVRITSDGGSTAAFAVAVHLDYLIF